MSANLSSDREVDSLSDNGVFSPLALVAFVLALIGCMSFLNIFVSVVSVVAVIAGTIVLFGAKGWELSKASRVIACLAVSIGIFTIGSIATREYLIRKQLTDNARTFAEKYVGLFVAGDYEQAQRLSMFQSFIGTNRESVASSYQTLESERSQLAGFKNQPSVKRLIDSLPDADWQPQGPVSIAANPAGLEFSVRFVDVRAASPQTMFVKLVREFTADLDERYDREKRRMVFWHAEDIEWP